MKKLKVLSAVGMIVVSSSLFVTSSANAEEASLEQQVSKVVLAQGQKVMSKLSTQLQQNIKSTLGSFLASEAASLNTEKVTLNSVSTKSKNQQKTAEE